MKEQFRIIKCKRCGTEYKMPNITNQEIIMNDCPVCQKLDKHMKELRLEF